MLIIILALNIKIKAYHEIFRFVLIYSTIFGEKYISYVYEPIKDSD